MLVFKRHRSKRRLQKAQSRHTGGGLPSDFRRQVFQSKNGFGTRSPIKINDLMLPAKLF